MTTPNIEELRKLAEAAHPEAHGYTGEWFTANALHLNFGLSVENAAYMAALDPATFIALCTSMQSQAERIKELSTKLQDESARFAEFILGAHAVVCTERDTLRDQLAEIEATEPVAWKIRYVDSANNHGVVLDESRELAISRCDDCIGNEMEEYSEPEPLFTRPMPAQDVNAELLEAAIDAIVPTENAAHQSVVVALRTVLANAKGAK